MATFQVDRRSMLRESVPVNLVGDMCVPMQGTFSLCQLKWRKLLSVRVFYVSLYVGAVESSTFSASLCAWLCQYLPPVCPCVLCMCASETSAQLCSWLNLPPWVCSHLIGKEHVSEFQGFDPIQSDLEYGRDCHPKEIK